MRKIALLLYIMVPVLLAPAMAQATAGKPVAPPDSEMVYRTNLGSVEDINLLLKQGGSLQAVDNNGIGLLFLAAARKDPEGLSIVKSLLKHGLDINSRDTSGKNALFYAAKSGNKDIVQYLLDEGIDGYATDNKGESARNYAYHAGNHGVVELMDAFARKKVEQVNAAYERVNREIAERYKALDEERRKAQAQTQKSLQKSINELKDAEQSAATQTSANAAQGAQAEATQTDNEQKTKEEVGKEAKETAAQEISENIRNKMYEAQLKQAIKEEELQKRKAEQELAAKIAEEKAQAAKAEKMAKANEAAKQALLKARAQKEKEEKAALALEETLNASQAEAYMKAEIAAEAALIKQHEEERLRAEREQMEKDPEFIKIKEELRKKREEEINSLSQELSYHNCRYQYWYYCYTAGQTTELSVEALREAIEDSKTKIEEISKTLMGGEYKQKIKSVSKVSNTAKKRVFNQLDNMSSKSQRRSLGVGNVSDMEKRCKEISLHWDVSPDSVVTEQRKQDKGDDDKSTKPAGNNNPIPASGSPPSTQPYGILPPRGQKR